MWTASQALNGILGVGVPQDWATHALGHEITALHGARSRTNPRDCLTRAIKRKRQEKYAKLIQYAQKVWGSIKALMHLKSIAPSMRLVKFFERMGLKTRLSDF